MKNPFCNPKPLHKCFRCGNELTHENVVLITYPDLDDMEHPYFFDKDFNLVERRINTTTFLDEDRIIEDYNEIEELCKGGSQLSIRCSCRMMYRITIDTEKFFDSHEFYQYIESLLNEFSTPPQEE